MQKKDLIVENPRYWHQENNGPVLNRGPSGVRSPVDGLCEGGSYADAAEHRMIKINLRALDGDSKA